jgi:hypothetical protein
MSFRNLLGSSKAILSLGQFDVRAAASDLEIARRRHRSTIDPQRSPMTRRPAPSPTAPGVRRSPLPVLVVLGAIAASLVLAACGGSSSPSNAAATERSQEQKAEVKFADFAKCLREHGVNAEAGSPGGGRGLRVSPGSGGPQQFEAAQRACARYRPEPKKVNLSPQQKVEQEEAVQKFAKCMREHGIKVEASTAGGGVQIRIHAHPGAEGGPNPESPAFQSAQQACQKLLPFKGGGPRPGDPPSTNKSGGKSGQAGGLALSAGG